jgi:hypothetical protein
MQTKEERIAAIPADVRDAIGTLRMMRHDLPDVMGEEISEILEAVRDYIRHGERLDWDGIKEQIDAMCEDEGFPSLFA